MNVTLLTNMDLTKNGILSQMLRFMTMILENVFGLKSVFKKNKKK